MVDLALSPDQQAVVDEAREIARRCLAPRATEHDRTGAFPAENISDLHAAGLLGLLVPEEYGGRGADLTTWALVVAELAEACGSTGLIFAMHSGAVRLVAAGAAGSPFAERVLREVVTEGKLLAWGFSEPGTGAQLLAPQLTAFPDGDQLHLSGTKAFCTAAGHADYYLVNADSGEQDFLTGQTMALVPADTVGLSVKEVWDALGMRANCANTLLLDCRIPVGNAIGGPGGGLLLLSQALPALFLGLSAASLGVARAARAFADAHVLRRTLANTGQPLAAFQGVRLHTADMAVSVKVAHLMLLHAAWVVDTDPAQAIPALNMAKYVANRAALDVADTAMLVTGGRGYLRSNPLERHYRDARAGAVMGSNLDVLRDLIGKTALGLDPFSDTVPERDPAQEPAS
ncbi:MULTISPECIES: acyl-CoA dehydrogenase family protein [Streptomyces]|uniref:Acyl-CoA dehydrogenase n=1 Tax=Streptomyces spororaveus TaxID=284039 RepID=A0ABQ3T5G3_9ACTN|nr:MULTISPECIES: acyl-CoA dehydrogenase family protein [Streptomyces]MCM9076581.1 acyl-CoA/acyl-ACP dehydrogenase [Streptomyces spororaveus]MCX5308761.1 acyl-CoA/acyl-ACP dehydrogenase [Streptomyces sp. NBC_00160]GHI75621.1 acyl-CoA dehydrogenase [Streptomyces spororaveus]